MRRGQLFLVLWAVYGTAHAASPATSQTLWLRFAQITDTQITDGESPARAVLSDRLVSGAWRPQEDYGLQTLEATLGVLRGYHDGTLTPQKRLDFIIQTGDALDNAQGNELQWFMRTMDGTNNEEPITPDSGEHDGAKRKVTKNLNPKLPFESRGVGSIPWYSVFGNHDSLAVGNFRINKDIEADPQKWYSPISELIAMTLGFNRIHSQEMRPTIDQSPAVIRGDEEYYVPGSYRLDIDRLKSGPIAPDPTRHFISRLNFMHAHFAPVSRSQPSGHGFTQENLLTGNTWYSVVPKPGVPVRLVVIDTVQHQAEWSSFGYQGRMTRFQFETFVKPTIEAAAKNGEYVLIFSHHPSTDFGLFGGSNLSTKEWRTYLSSQKNVLAHICGHTHRHHTTLVRDGKYPYMEIETGSIIDFPQEARIFEISFDESTKDLSFESVLVSHRDQPTDLSSESYRRSEADLANFAEHFRTGSPDRPPHDILDPTRILNEIQAELPNLRPWTMYGFGPNSIRGREEDRHIIMSYSLKERAL